MSTHIKVNVAVLTAILSALGTAFYVALVVGAKANDIDVSKQDIAALRVDMQSVIRYTERLDERSKSSEKMLDSLSARIQGISSQIGVVRSEVREAHEN